MDRLKKINILTNYIFWNLLWNQKYIEHTKKKKKRNKTQKQDNRNVLKSQLRKSSKSARFLRAQSSTHPSLRVSNTMPSQNMRDNKRRGSLRKLSVFAVGFAVGRTCGRRRRWPGANWTQLWRQTTTNTQFCQPRGRHVRRRSFYSAPVSSLAVGVSL